MWQQQQKTNTKHFRQHAECQPTGFREQAEELHARLARIPPEHGINHDDLCMKSSELVVGLTLCECTRQGSPDAHLKGHQSHSPRVAFTQKTVQTAPPTVVWRNSSASKRGLVGSQGSETRAGWAGDHQGNVCTRYFAGATLAIQ